LGDAGIVDVLGATVVVVVVVADARVAATGGDFVVVVDCSVDAAWSH
jgi:hypothetical protein